MVALAVIVAVPLLTPVRVIWLPLLALVELMLTTVELEVDQVMLLESEEVALILAVFPRTIDKEVVEMVTPVEGVPDVYCPLVP